MPDDILSRLQEKSHTFSKGQKAIARYITEYYDKAAFMTASSLGKRVNVSESTVVRFAAELGYDGYPAMLKAMQEMVLHRLTSVQRIEVANSRLADHDVLTSVLQSDMEKLRLTLETVSREDFTAAVDAILHADKIVIMGVRSAAPLVNFLSYYLSYMLPNVRTVTTSGTSEMFEHIVDMGSRDVLIAFSFPRYSVTTAKGAEFCRRNGATVIGITDSRLSPLGASCDRVLIAKSDMLSLVDSLVAPLSLVNALVVAIASRREKELSEKLSRLESIWQEYHVYETRENGNEF